jgi:hypothetical protein
MAPAEVPQMIGKGVAAAVRQQFADRPARRPGRRRARRPRSGSAPSCRDDFHWHPVTAGAPALKARQRLPSGLLRPPPRHRRQVDDAPHRGGRRQDGTGARVPSRIGPMVTPSPAACLSRLKAMLAASSVGMMSRLASPSGGNWGRPGAHVAGKRRVAVHLALHFQLRRASPTAVCVALLHLDRALGVS